MDRAAGIDEDSEALRIRHPVSPKDVARTEGDYNVNARGQKDWRDRG